MTRVYIGTCSWSDHKPFYPKGLPSGQQLVYYAQRFPIVEINSSYYRMMPPRNYQLWAERTPPGFLFDVKPFKQITWHARKNPPTVENTAAFSEALQPLRKAGKLGAIHCQFPPWFQYRPENLDYLHLLRDRFAEDALAVEFRNRTWLEGDHLPTLLHDLSSHDIGLSIVDEPQLGSGSAPTLLAVTRPKLAIVRFHGRNAQRWYAHVQTTGERFDYCYSEDELRAWVPNVLQLAESARELHLLFNNNAHDYAVRNARQLRTILCNDTELDVIPATVEQLPLL